MGGTVVAYRVNGTLLEVILSSFKSCVSTLRIKSRKVWTPSGLPFVFIDRIPSHCHGEERRISGLGTSSSG